MPLGLGGLRQTRGHLADLPDAARRARQVAAGQGLDAVDHRQRRARRPRSRRGPSRARWSPPGPGRRPRRRRARRDRGPGRPTPRRSCRAPRSRASARRPASCSSSVRLADARDRRRTARSSRARSRRPARGRPRRSRSRAVPPPRSRPTPIGDAPTAHAGHGPRRRRAGARPPGGCDGLDQRVPGPARRALAGPLGRCGAALLAEVGGLGRQARRSLAAAIDAHGRAACTAARYRAPWIAGLAARLGGLRACRRCWLARS